MIVKGNYLKQIIIQYLQYLNNHKNLDYNIKILCKVF